MEGEDELKKIHTYQSDVQEALQKSSISTTQVFVAEQEKKQEEQRQSQIDSRPTERSFNFRAIILTIIILLVIGAAGYYFIEKRNSADSTPIISTIIPDKDIIATDSKIDLTLPQTKQDLVSLIQTNKQNDATIGIEQLNFNTTTDQLFYLFDPYISGSFLRYLDPKFVFGLYKLDANSPAKSFLVAKINSYSTIKGSLLSEEVVLASQLSEIFDIPNTHLVFKDVVLDNHDARALIDDQNGIHFLYSLIDDETLVIAADDITFNVIIQKLIY